MPLSRQGRSTTRVRLTDVRPYARGSRGSLGPGARKRAAADNRPQAYHTSKLLHHASLVAGLRLLDRPLHQLVPHHASLVAGLKLQGLFTSTSKLLHHASLVAGLRLWQFNVKSCWCLTW